MHAVRAGHDPLMSNPASPDGLQLTADEREALENVAIFYDVPLAELESAVQATLRDEPANLERRGSELRER